MAEAAWYPDLERTGWLRYWDGTRWTDHRAPMPPPSGFPVQGPPPRRSPIDAELAASGNARTAIMVYGAVLALTAPLNAVVMAQLRDLIEQFFDASDSADPETFGTSWGIGFTLVSGVSQLLSMAVLAAGIYFVIWVYRASATARDLDYPQQWSQVWAWLGFIVPIMNLFVPYQMLRDALSSGTADRGRSVLIRWWACFLGASVSGFSVLPMGIAGVDVAVWILAVISAICWLGVGLLGRTLVDTIADDHRRATDARSRSSV
ncbi:MAG: DUF4328 domain-containing protein [Acidimicrobiales bacterium]|nr:DUF4328 domain-containing protein [Acidimicrobiales bacterium]